MRHYYDINLSDRTIDKRELEGEAIVKAGRYLIAKTLLELGAATVDPLSPANPLIFSAGPFAGTSFSNANRTSVGCKSPLTGGVKEANGGGSVQLWPGPATRSPASRSTAPRRDWVVIHFKKDGTIDFDDAAPYLGKGNFEAQSMLHTQLRQEGDHRACAAPSANTRASSRASPSATRTAGRRGSSARGGVGAVMGSKKVKAIVVDLDKIPPFHEPKKVNAAHQGLRQDAPGRRHRAELLRQDRHHGHGRRAEPAWAGCRCATSARAGWPTSGRGREVQDGRRLHRPAQHLARRRADARLHARLRHPVQQRLPRRERARKWSRRSSTRRSGCSAPTAASAIPTTSRSSTTSPTTWASTRSRPGAMLAVLMEAGLGAFGDVKFMADCLAEIRQGHGAGPHLGAGHGAGGRALQGPARARHQEAGDQRLRPARGRGHRHHHDGDGPGRRPYRGQFAAPQDARDGRRAAIVEPEPGASGAGRRQRLARASASSA